MNIYVGNLSFQAEAQDLEELFGQFGEVTNSRLITDRDTGRARGFGFVEMASQSAGLKAIEALDSKDFMGRDLKVNEARPREEQQRRRPSYA